MPIALPVDWNEVRTLAIAIGVREAARHFGISEDSALQRSKREGWFAEQRQIAEQRAQFQQQRREQLGLSSPVIKATDAIGELGKSTKFYLATAANKASRRLSEMDADELMLQGQVAVQYTKVAATVHGFGGDGAVSLRLELIARGHGSAADESGATLDAEVEITRPDADSDDL